MQGIVQVCYVCACACARDRVGCMYPQMKLHFTCLCLLTDNLHLLPQKMQEYPRYTLRTRYSRSSDAFSRSAMYGTCTHQSHVLAVRQREACRFLLQQRIQKIERV